MVTAGRVRGRKGEDGDIPAAACVGKMCDTFPHILQQLGLRGVACPTLHDPAIGKRGMLTTYYSRTLPAAH